MSNEIEEITTISKGKKLTSGLDGLDFQLGGGIPEGSLILLYGDPLSGMEKFSVQFWKADEGSESSYFVTDSLVSEGMSDASNLNPEEITWDMSGKRVVVDSLSTLLIKNGIADILKFLRESSAKIKEERGNMLLLMYPGIHTSYDEILVKRNCDTVFILNQNAHGSELERNLQVSKIGGMDVPNRVFPYNILEKGIELSTTGRVV